MPLTRCTAKLLKEIGVKDADSVQCPRCRNVWNDYLSHVEFFTPPVCRAYNVHPVLLLNVCWQPDISENQPRGGARRPKDEQKILEP